MTPDSSGPPAADAPLLDAHGLTRYLPAERRGMPARAAIDGVSLSLRRGDVLGLLGLNGAGKSTTLRILSGCLLPHSGRVQIAGHDLHDAPLEARAALGYLADQPPLYDDLRVTGFLELAARLRRVPRADIARSVAAVIEECKLDEVAGRRLGTLSKGYRQRVGIAQAIVHDPAVVLLDEPSNGLDPHQMDDMRDLLRRLGAGRAVLLSSHLLGEVQASCTRIAILHQGQLVADRDLTDVQAGGESLGALFSRLIGAAAA